jgi:hypothetical protein
MPGSVARPWAPEPARHGITASSQARAVASVFEARRDVVRHATNADAYGCRAPCCGRLWQPSANYRRKERNVHHQHQCSCAEGGLALTRAALGADFYGSKCRLNPDDLELGPI